jgi:hypothetical protein
MTEQELTKKERVAARKKAREFEAAFRSARRSAKEAIRLARLDKRPPTEADRPRQPSQPPRVLAGQTDIYGVTHGLAEPTSEEEPDE